MFFLDMNINAAWLSICRIGYDHGYELEMRCDLTWEGNQMLQ